MNSADRLRAYALSRVAWGIFGVDDEAVCALADQPDPTAWKPWQETRAESGQWFLWRNPDQPERLHADQVEPDARGFIEMKHGCGLNFYPECQPLSVSDDVKAAMAEGHARARAGQ